MKTEAKTRADLDKMLDALEAEVPAMLEQCPDDGDFWAEFAGHADVIEDAARQEDCEHVTERMHAIVDAIKARLAE
ncbi:hypothetical protein OCJ37_14200 [Xanthomonas sp. AM6]|uniref:hypothetical protein n=1 Tax=Xanthomonas sp. AM6 TaxID=2982531 RepID=UPI0021DAD85D|nr:hypothetical protein [Xanthomonas sp. AM6]UYB51137.1 hypothetical protein OCJ37_14200 [Xanthomonas sp. AM6]